MAFGIIDRKNDKQTQRERAQIDDTEMLSVLLGERERERDKMKNDFLIDELQTTVDMHD